MDSALRNGRSQTFLEESLEELYEHAACGYVSTLPDGRIIKVNETFLEWTGYRRADLVDRLHFVDLLTTGGKLYHESHFAPLLQLQSELREIAFELACPRGVRLPVLVHAVLERDEAGRPRQIRSTLFNATERRAYERELLTARHRAEDAVQQKIRFISMLSHEIRNPLTAMFHATSLLGRTELTPAQASHVELLASCSRELADLVSNVLDFTKIEAGQLPLEERPLELREWIDQIVDSLRARPLDPAVALGLSVDPEIPNRLVGDRIKLRQILTNLLSNALKFTERGCVTLAIELLGQSASLVSLRFTVTDTGIGIAPDRLQAIFEDFTQADYDIAATYGGSGLGLAICKKLLALYDSRMVVRSSPGQGSEFSFDLGLKLAPAESAAGRRAEDPLALAGMAVLLVDDDEVNVLGLSGLMCNWGVLLDIAVDTHHAARLVQQNHYDLVLMDLRGPMTDSNQAARSIRQLPNPELAALPIVAISTSTRMSDGHELDAAGFTDFIGKPIASEVLFAKLARYRPHDRR